ncbi:MAG: hypothetical protein ACRDNB_07590 [Gaiellaceae bacterium]
MERKPPSKPHVQLVLSPTPSTWALSEAEIAAFKVQSDRTTHQMRAILLGAPKTRS